MSAGRGRVLVLVLVAAFAIGVASENRARTLALRSTFPQDLGAFNNQAVNAALGRDVSYLTMAAWFRPGEFDGPALRRSAHFTPLRTLLLPFVYRLAPRIETGMLFQGLLIGLGALGLYGFAVERTGSPGCGLLVAGSYLLHPALLNTAANDLREITLGIGPALLALWLHASGRYRAFVVAALVTLAARSEYVLLVAAIGFVNLRLTTTRRPALSLGLPVALAAAWAGLAEAYYLHYYGLHWPLLGLGGGATFVESFSRLASRLVPFLTLMQAPALLALAAPETVALALPFVAFAKRVHAMEFPPNHLQHLAPAMVAVFWGFAITVTRLWGATRLRGPLVSGLLLAGGASALVFGYAAGQAYPRDLTAFEAIGTWADTLPLDATVVVPGPLVARFSSHTRVLDYENLPVVAATPAARDAQARVLFSADLVATRAAPALNATLKASGLFEPPRRFRLYRIFVRRRDAPRVERPDALLQEALRWRFLTRLQKRGARLPGG